MEATALPTEPQPLPNIVFVFVYEREGENDRKRLKTLYSREWDNKKGKDRVKDVYLHKCERLSE